jgi:hypothetical protein
MRTRRIYDTERHAHFITFSCYKRRRLLDVDRSKRIVLGVLNSQLARQKGRCVGFCGDAEPRALPCLVPPTTRPRSSLSSGRSARPFKSNDWPCASLRHEMTPMHADVPLFDCVTIG